MQALLVLCLCGIVVTCEEPHKVECSFLLYVALRVLKGGVGMGQRDDVLTDDREELMNSLL